jgi:hypothetical protein
VKTNSRNLVLRTRQKPHPIYEYITDVKNISPLIQLLEQIAKQQYEVPAHNQDKVKPKTSESYRTVIKALAKKGTEFHTYKLKEVTD